MTFNLRKSGLNDSEVRRCSIESRKAEIWARNDDKDARGVVGCALLVKVGVRVKVQGTLGDVRSTCGSKS